MGPVELNRTVLSVCEKDFLSGGADAAVRQPVGGDEAVTSRHQRKGKSVMFPLTAGQIERDVFSALQAGQRPVGRADPFGAADIMQCETDVFLLSFILVETSAFIILRLQIRFRQPCRYAKCPAGRDKEDSAGQIISLTGTQTGRRQRDQILIAGIRPDPQSGCKYRSIKAPE